MTYARNAVLLATMTLLLTACTTDLPTQAIESEATLEEATEAAVAKRGDTGPVSVLGTRLRPIGGGDFTGHLHLRLRATRDGAGYLLSITGLILNRAGETFIAGDILQVAPEPTHRPVLTLFRDGEAACRVIGLRGAGVIDADLARHMIASPSQFAAIFTTATQPDGALLSVFSNPGPPNRPEKNPGPPQFPPNPCVVEVHPTLPDTRG